MGQDKEEENKNEQPLLPHPGLRCPALPCCVITLAKSGRSAAFLGDTGAPGPPACAAASAAASSACPCASLGGIIHDGRCST